MRITAEEVKMVADLVHLRLDDRHLEKMRTDLGAILDHVRKLEDVDTSGLAPLYNPAETGENVTRVDEVTEANISEDFLRAAPEREGGWVVVPRFAGSEEGGNV
ncbi:MAG: Asp-tRNA(Asn)/Glu-tRNA(Gln) amidotransferase subunit GatC [Bacillota bacterium]